MSDDTLSERVMLALIEADEVIYRTSDVNYFIERSQEAYEKVDAVFANGAKYKDWELYEARRNAKLAQRKAKETSKLTDLVLGYKKLAQICSTQATKIQKEELDHPLFKSSIPYYEKGRDALLTDAKSIIIFSSKI